MGCFRDMTYQRSTMHEATVRSLYDMMSRTATPTVARVCVAGYSVDDWRSLILLCRLGHECLDLIASCLPEVVAGEESSVDLALRYGLGPASTTVLTHHP